MPYFDGSDEMCSKMPLLRFIALTFYFLFIC